MSAALQNSVRSFGSSWYTRALSPCQCHFQHLLLCSKLINKQLLPPTNGGRSGYLCNRRLLITCTPGTLLASVWPRSGSCAPLGGETTHKASFNQCLSSFLSSKKRNVADYNPSLMTLHSI